MKCYICDKTVNGEEINILPDGSFDCCGTCLDIAMEAAYADGFIPGGDVIVDSVEEDSSSSSSSSVEGDCCGGGCCTGTD